jgi:hypothetical protein
MKKLLFLLFSLHISLSQAQILTGISARYNDAFVDWDIYTDNDDEQGSLTMTWQKPDDWTQWTYRIGDKSGTIKTKWIRDISLWEVRGDNKIITIQMMWANDPRSWRITDNTMSIDVKSRLGMDFQEWNVDEGKRGKLNIFMDKYNDPRDWNIEDELDESIPLPMKIAILFIVMFNSVPKS